MEPDDIIEHGQGRPACAAAAAPASRPGMKWGFIPQDNPKPKYLVVNADESEPGTCKDIPLMMANAAHADRGRHHRLARDPRQAPRSSTCAARCCTSSAACAPPCARPTRPATSGRDIHGSGYDLDLVIHAGAGAYICGEETALLDSLEGRRGQPRLRPPFPAVEGLYASPDRRQQRRVDRLGAGDHPRRRRVVRLDGHREVQGLTASTRCRATSSAPASTRRRSASRCASCSTSAAACATGRELKFWTPGGSSTPILTAEHLDVPLDYEARRRGRLDARHPGAADLRPDHVGRAVRAALDRVLQARVVRQVHPVPRGHVVARADPAAPRRRARARPATSSCCSTCATTSSAARSARSATAPRAPSRRRSSTSARSSRPACTRRRSELFPPAASTLFAQEVTSR